MTHILSTLLATSVHHNGTSVPLTHTDPSGHQRALRSHDCTCIESSDWRHPQFGGQAQTVHAWMPRTLLSLCHFRMRRALKLTQLGPPIRLAPPWLSSPVRTWRALVHCQSQIGPLERGALWFLPQKAPHRQPVSPRRQHQQRWGP